MAGTIKLPLQVELRLFHGLQGFPLADILCGVFFFHQSRAEFTGYEVARVLRSLAWWAPDVFTAERIALLQTELDWLEFVRVLRRAERPGHYIVSAHILERYPLLRDRQLLPYHEAALRFIAKRLWDQQIAS